MGVKIRTVWADNLLTQWYSEEDENDGSTSRSHVLVCTCIIHAFVVMTFIANFSESLTPERLPLLH